MPDKDGSIKSIPECEAKAYLAAIVDSSNDCIVSKTLDGMISSWNRGAQNLYGYSAEEVVGRHISVIVPPDRLEELEKVTETIRRGERVERFQTQRIRKDGRRIDVCVTLSPIHGNDGAIIGVSAISREITEELKMERSLRESERRYRTLIEMARDAVVVHQEGRFVYANCAALGIYGARSLEELQQMTLVDLVHPDEREEVRERMQQLLEGEEIPLREYRLLRVNGEEIPVETSSTLIDYEGRPGIQIIARDISDRKRAEEEREAMLRDLFYERSRFQTVVRQLAVGIFIAEAPSGKLLFDNDVSRHIFRQEPAKVESLADYSQWDIRTVDGKPIPVEELPLVRALRGEVVTETELQVIRGDGTIGYVRMNVAHLADPDGAITAAIAIITDVTERKVAQQALEASEERLNLALDAAEMGSCDIELPSGRGVWSNRHFLLLGYPPPVNGSGAATIEMWQSRIHPDDRAMVSDAVAHARKERTFLRSEHRVIRADNQQVVWVNIMGRFLCDEKRGTCRFIGVIFDVSERKAAEDALRRNESRFRLMADSMPQIVWTAEPDGSIDYVNAHFEVYSGLSRQSEEVSRNLDNPAALIAMMFHPDDVEVATRAWTHSIATGEPYHTELRLRRADGAYRWHLNRALADRDESGMVLKWYGTATDINEIRELQEKLQASEADLKLAIETTQLGTFDWDLRSGKQRWSDIARSHYGLPQGVEVTGAIHMSAVHPDDRERVRQAIKAALDPQGSRSLSLEYRTVGLEDAKTRWLTARGRVTFDQEDQPLRLSAACLDITDIVEAEKALKDEIAERLRAVEELHKQEQLMIRQGRLAAMGEMIGNIAHQWRQPLNTLALIVQELPRYYERNLFSKEYLDRSVTKAMQVINHMSKTIDGFRNFFGPEKEKEVFRASEVLSKTVSMVEAAFAQLDLKIEMSLDPGIEIFGYPNEFSQVLLNILVNAKEAIVERKVSHPKVAVKLYREGDKAVLTITDNGGGIPQEVMERIFDPYFTTKGPDKGTGIGLFMSKTIIEKNMNGSLTVHNTGEGAEFRIEVAA